jgi:hypothetical protein
VRLDRSSTVDDCTDAAGCLPPWSAVLTVEDLNPGELQRQTHAKKKVYQHERYSTLLGNTHSLRISLFVECVFFFPLTNDFL